MSHFAFVYNDAVMFYAGSTTKPWFQGLNLKPKQQCHHEQKTAVTQVRCCIFQGTGGLRSRFQQSLVMMKARISPTGLSATLSKHTMCLAIPSLLLALLLLPGELQLAFSSIWHHFPYNHQPDQHFLACAYN